MDEKEERWLQTLREGFVDEVDEETVIEFAEELKRHAAEFERKSREKGARWPKNLVEDVFRLRSAEWRDSVGGESLDETISHLLETLSERKTVVVQKFYREEKSIEEIGNEFGVFYPEIYDILWQALAKFRIGSRGKRLAQYILRSEGEQDRYGPSPDDFTDGQDDPAENFPAGTEDSGGRGRRRRPHQTPLRRTRRRGR